MVIVAHDPAFDKALEKLGDALLKERVKKQIAKIVANPEVGKPMRYSRKGTREVRIEPFRLSYLYSKEEDKIALAKIYHKDEQ